MTFSDFMNLVYLGTAAATVKLLLSGLGALTRLADSKWKLDQGDNDAAKIERVTDEVSRSMPVKLPRGLLRHTVRNLPVVKAPDK